jgi:hypothetical protein
MPNPLKWKPEHRTGLLVASAAGAVLGVAVIVGAYFLFAREKKNQYPAIAGWDEIDECAPFTSFDGSQTLDFERSHKVSVAKKPSTKIDGTWSFNEEKKRYTLFFGEASSDYILIKPNNSDLCILAIGDIGSVNMRESWFALIDATND